MTMTHDSLDGLIERVERPLAPSRFGGSPKTATSAFAISTDATTVHGNRSGQATLWSDPETKSSSEQSEGMRHSVGAIPSIAATGKRGLSATSSATKVRTYRRSLSDKLTLSLISSGLVCGITPSLTRKRSGQPILVLALDVPGGGAAERPSAGSSSLSESPHEVLRALQSIKTSETPDK
jgi:hypothetical protein